MSRRSRGRWRLMMVIPGLEAGGAERQLGYLARGLAKIGHQVHIVTVQKAATGQPAWPAGISLDWLGGWSNYDPRLFSRLRRMVRETEPDLIQTWNPQTDILGGLAAVSGRCPWIIREPNCAQFYRKSWKAGARAFLGRRAAAVAANSSGGADYWRDLYPEKPGYVVPNGLPLEEIELAVPADREELGIGPGQKFVLYAGRLAQQKMVGRIIDSAAAVRGTDFKLVICGRGKEQGKLETHAREIGVAGRVSFTGFVNTERVWSLMKAADLFISLSDYEGMSNTVMEAMACRTPLLVSDIPSHRELLDGGCAALVDPDDTSSAAAGISFLLSSRSAGLRQQRATAAREKVAGWSISALVAGYVRIYREILSRRGGVRR